MIYRYSGWNENLKNSLKNRYFWFSKPTNFNDPFDSNMDCLKEFNLTSKLFCYNDSSQVYPLTNPFEYIKKQTNNFGVLCFTEKTGKGDIGDEGFNNNHFWSHYAEFHKGIALGFDKSIIKTYYSEKISCQADLTKVKYRTKPINLDKDDIVLEKREDGEITKKVSGIFSKGGSKKEQDIFFKELLLSKDSRIWGIENESRIILGGLALANINNFNPFGKTDFDIITDYGYKIPFPNGEILKEVTFGVKFPKNKIDGAKEIINNSHKNVQFYQAELDFVNGIIQRKKI